MDCLTCGASFDTDQGMRIHHGHKHDTDLPNRTCKGCGEAFYDPKSRLQYCDSCNPNAGKNNGNWSGAKERGLARFAAQNFRIILQRRRESTALNALLLREVFSPKTQQREIESAYRVRTAVSGLKPILIA